MSEVDHTRLHDEPTSMHERDFESIHLSTPADNRLAADVGKALAASASANNASSGSASGGATIAQLPRGALPDAADMPPVERRRAPTVEIASNDDSFCGGKYVRRGLGCIAFIMFIVLLAIVIVRFRRDPPPGLNPYDVGPWHNVRLPTTVVPLHYRLNTTIDLARLQFSGTVDIEYAMNGTFGRGDDAVAGGDSILIHAADMTIEDAYVTSVASTVSGLVMHVHTPWNTFSYNQYDYYVMQFEPDTLPETCGQAGSGVTCVLHLRYSAALTDSLTGLYYSTYTNNAGELKYLATTQMEPTDARRAFPCFDEPAMKANFTISVIAAADRTVLSNMPAESTVALSPYLTQTTFYPSVRMSTYLVGIIVCDFGFVSNYTIPSALPGAVPILVRVWSPVDKIAQTGIALAAACKIVTSYENYFGVRYPLPKLDMVAIPDFAAGAMENWGLITYRETALLFDPLESSARDEERVVSVVAHELAHQWFGNIVTMKWWDGLWLNEGFATYVEYIGMNAVHPEWQSWTEFVESTQQVALDLDASDASHPIVQTVGNPSEINELFDEISYEKGGSVIRVLQNFLGDSVFRAGLTYYLTQHAYGNAATDDLWAAMQWSLQQSGNAIAINVKEIMDHWTLKQSYPLLTVSVTNEFDGSVVVSQQRFNPTVNHTFPPSEQYSWSLALTFRTQISPNNIPPQKWMYAASNDGGVVPALTLATTYNPTTSGWVKIDPDERSYYLVNYPVSNWVRLSTALAAQDAGLTPSDRVGLVYDAFSLASSGALGIDVAMKLSQFLKNELNYDVWLCALNQFAKIDVLIREQPDYGSFLTYLQSLIEPPLLTLGFASPPNSSTRDRQLRGLLVSAGVRYGLPSAIAYATTTFNTFLNAPSNDVASEVPVDVRPGVYAQGVSGGSEREWSFMFGEYRNATVSSEQRRCMAALAASRQPWLLSRLLSFTLNTNLIRAQDAVSVVSAVAANPIGRPIAWEWFRRNWNALSQRYGASMSFGTLIQAVTMQCTSNQQLTDIRGFFANLKLGSAQRSYAQSVAAIQSNIVWLASNYSPLVTWLQTNQP